MSACDLDVVGFVLGKGIHFAFERKLSFLAILGCQLAKFLQTEWGVGNEGITFLAMWGGRTGALALVFDFKCPVAACWVAFSTADYTKASATLPSHELGGIIMIWLLVGLLGIVQVTASVRHNWLGSSLALGLLFRGSHGVPTCSICRDNLLEQILEPKRLRNHII